MCSPHGKATMLSREGDDLQVWKCVRVLGTCLFSGSFISCQLLGFSKGWAQTLEAA